MTASKARSSLVVLAIASFSCPAAFAQDQAAPQQHSIAWSDDLFGSLDRGAQENKPVVVCFVASWCSACAAFEREALRSAEVNALADRFVWVKLDVERNISLVRAYEIRATPRIDLLEPGGKTRLRISGALPSREFREQLDLFLNTLQQGKHSGVHEVDGSFYTPLTETPAGYRGLSICYSNVGYGPLRLASQSPFQSLRFGLVPRTPSTLAEGQWEAHFSETWVNAFIYDEGKTLLDYEALDTRLSLSYGLIDELQLELEYENRSAFGGIMDRFVNAFHRTFGLTDAGRHNFPNNQFRAQISDQTGTPTVDLGSGDKGSFSNSFLLTIQHNVTCGTDVLPAFGYSLTLRAEVNNEFGPSGGLPVEPQLSISASKAVGDFYLYGSVGFAYFGTEYQGEIKFRPTQISGLAAVEWRFSASMSLILQYLVTQGVVESMGPFSTNSHEITLGWKGELVDGLVFEFGLIENLINFSNSPDFGLHAGAMIRF